MLASRLAIVLFVLISVAVNARAEAPSSEIASQFVRTITVRIYNRSRVQAIGIPRARARAEGILRSAGLEVIWIVCSARDHWVRDEQCDGALEWPNLALRLVEGLATTRDGLVLGHAHVDRSSRQGTLASVFQDSIAATASRLRVDQSALLGRVMAHEIGHLLGMTEHSAVGLMRKHWSDEGLQRDVDSDFLFAPDEASRLRHELALRDRARQQIDR